MADPKLGLTQQKVLDHLRKAGGAYSVEDIATTLRITKNAVKGALLRLITHGLVMRSQLTKHNLWSATPPALAGDAPAHTPPLHGDVPSA